MRRGAFFRLPHHSLCPLFFSLTLSEFLFVKSLPVLVVSCRFVTILVIFIFGSAVLGAQDTIYTHWPAVKQSAFDPATRDMLFRQTEVLLAKPISLPAHRAAPAAEGGMPGWKTLEDARRRLQQGDFSGASQRAENALNAARKRNDRRLEMQALSTIGGISREVFLGASLKAVPYHEEALQIALELHDSAYIISQLMSLADNYGQAGQNDRFLGYLRRAVAVLTSYDQPGSRLGVGVMFGCFLETQGEPLRSEKIFRLTLALALKTGNLNFAQHIHVQLFWLFLGMGDADKAESALNAARTTGDKMPEKDIFEAYYQLEKLRGNREQAFRYLEKSYQLLGTQYSERSAEQLAGWETRLRTREKELQLEAQQRLLEEQKKWRLYLSGLIALVSVLLFASLIGWYKQRQARWVLYRQNQIIERQSAELQQLDQLKSRFFANVSHELRTPLTLILGPISQALEDKDISPERIAMLKMAQRNSQTLLNLVNEILELSKLQATQPELQEQPTVLFDFLKETIDTFQSYANSRKIELRLEFKPEKSLTLALDRKKLFKIINNLLSNSVKFSPNESAVEVCVEARGQDVLIQVRDAGPGIHPEDLPHIFDLYYQSRRPEAKAEGGTGIGLTLSRELAQAMNGRLWAESTLGMGSTFSLAVPAKECLPTAVVPIDPQLRHTGDLSIPEHQPAATSSKPPAEISASLLVVEDNTDLQAYLRTVLSDDYYLTFVDNGRAALEYLESAGQVPDLILSDVMMPLMDGFQLLETLRASEQWRNIPVILLTALAERDSRMRAFRIGIDDYVIKPFSPEELQVRIENALRNQSVWREWIESEQAEETGMPETEGAWLRQLRETALERLGNPLFNVDDLAEQMRVSRKTLYRLVRKHTGLSANQFIQELRLLQARELLETGQFRTLRRVAEAVGFRSSDYFSRLYRTRFGKSPADDL